MVQPATFTVKADLSEDGKYETDWSPYVLGIDVQLGRQSAVDEFGPRKLTLLLDNDDGRFSPRKATGPYFPDLVAGRRVQVQSQITIEALTNLVANPSLETDEAGWTVTFGGSGVKSQTALAARWGGLGYQLTATTSGGFTVDNDVTDDPTQSLDYTASIYVRGINSNADGKRWRLEITEVGGVQPEATTVSAYQEIGLFFERLEVTRNIVESDRTGLRLRLRREDADHTANETFAVDGGQVEQASSASAYTDGDRIECSWVGTAHASNSTRNANPTLTLFTGELASMHLQRPDLVGRALYELTGVTESLRRTVISAGPFSREDAAAVVQRVINIVDSEAAIKRGFAGELIKDGAMRYGAENYVPRSGPTVTKESDSGAAGDDPVIYDALEGDNVLRVSAIDSLGEGWELDVTAITTQTGLFHIGCFFRAASSAENGLTVALNLVGPSNVVGQTITLSDTKWTYAEIFGIFDPDLVGGSRVLRGVANDAGWTGSKEFWTDCLSMSEPPQDLTITPWIEFRTLGTHWADDIEYIDAFQRSANAFLDEIAASIGGWVYEDGAGELVFEDYSTRLPAAQPTLSISDRLNGGYSHKLLRYSQPLSGLGLTVKVGSFGDVKALPSGTNARHKQVWNLEPGSLALSANQERIFHADHVIAGGELEGGLIARRPGAIAIPVAGWGTIDGKATPFVKSFGRSSEVHIKAPGGGATIFLLLLFARPAHREQTERVFVRVGTGDPEMVLEMPAQGDKTQAMTDLATWAETKYSKAPAVVDVEIVGDDDAASLLDLFGTEVGRAVHYVCDNPPGEFGLAGTFFVEGTRLSWTKGTIPDIPRLRLHLEEA